MATPAELIPDNEEERLEAVRRYAVLDTPPDGAFDRITALAARHFDVPFSIVSIVDSDRIWFKSHHGLDVEEIGRDPGLCASAILQNEPWVVSDAANDPRTLTNPLVAGDFGLRFYAGVPLTTRDGYNLGTLCLLDQEPRELSDDETATLQDMAAIVQDELELRLAARREVALERERSRQANTEKERAERLSRTLQATLLPPKLPQVPGLEVAAHYRPLALEEVGGDFYDVFPLDNRRWGFFLGDICGKGPEAAALTSLARYTLRTAAMLKEDPSDALVDLNAALLLENPRELSLCTAVYGYVEPAEDGMSLCIARAGHPPPLILRAGCRVEAIATHGPLLGLLHEPRFEVKRETLRRGDALVTYTDGLVDVEHRGELLTEESLAEMMGAGARSARQLVTDLRRLTNELGDSLRDDVAILAMSVEADD